MSLRTTLQERLRNLRHPGPGTPTAPTAPDAALSLASTRVEAAVTEYLEHGRHTDPADQFRIARAAREMLDYGLTHGADVDYELLSPDHLRFPSLHHLNDEGDLRRLLTFARTLGEMVARGHDPATLAEPALRTTGRPLPPPADPTRATVAHERLERHARRLMAHRGSNEMERHYIGRALEDMYIYGRDHAADPRYATQGSRYVRAVLLHGDDPHGDVHRCLVFARSLGEAVALGRDPVLVDAPELRAPQALAPTPQSAAPQPGVAQPPITPAPTAPVAADPDPARERLERYIAAYVAGGTHRHDADRFRIARAARAMLDYGREHGAGAHYQATGAQYVQGVSLHHSRDQGDVHRLLVFARTMGEAVARGHDPVLVPAPVFRTVLANPAPALPTPAQPLPAPLPTTPPAPAPRRL